MVSEKKNLLLIFFFFLHFLNLDSILDISEKKIILIGDGCLKLRIPQNVVSYTSKKSCFRGPFDK